MGLIRLALGNVYGVIVLALFISILGSVALLSIPVDILPQFITPAVQVLTLYGGMPSRPIERTITDRIERWVNQAPGVRNVESRSVSGVSVVRVIFQDDTDPNAALTLSSTLVAGAPLRHAAPRRDAFRPHRHDPPRHPHRLESEPGRTGSERPRAGGYPQPARYREGLRGAGRGRRQGSPSDDLPETQGTRSAEPFPGGRGEGARPGKPARHARHGLHRR